MTPRGTPLPRTRSQIEGVEWPSMLVGEAAILAALIQQLEEEQWAAAADTAARQRAQLVALARHCGRHSKQFRGRLAAAKLRPDDLGAPEALRQLPPLRRRDIQTAGAELFCREVPQTHLPTSDTRTSGSTGEPVVVRRTAVSQLMWLALAMRDHLWHGRDFTRRLAVTRATARKLEQHADWGPPVSLLFRTGAAISIPSNLDIRKLRDELAAFQPDNLLIYPSTLDALTRYSRKLDFRLPTLRHIRTTGETLSPQVREDAAAAFGATVEDTYSSQELGYIALQCPESGLYHVMSESVIVEVIDDDGRPCGEGEAGRVIATDLHNFATPLIRYEIGDYAEVGGACPCGRGLPTLRRIIGRHRNLILMPDGSRHWPRTGFRGFRDIAPISQYQFIQRDRERIEARFVAEQPLTPDQEAALRAHIQGSIGHPFSLTFVYFPDRIPVGANGKFEDFICEAKGEAE